MIPGASHWPGDARALRDTPMPGTQGEDSLHARTCVECGIDCTDLCVAVFVSGWFFYCVPHAIEFTRAYLAEAARAAGPS